MASVLRLGFVANFISEPVLVGFKAGIAVVIILDQIPKVLGIHFPRAPSCTTWEPSYGDSGGVDPTLVAGLLTMAGLVAIERLKPRWPAPLLVIAAAIAGVGLLGGSVMASSWWARFPGAGHPPGGRPGGPGVTPGALGMALR